MRTGVGAGYRAPIGRGLQDNFFEATLTYEPGYLFFSRGGDTASIFVLPRDTYEGREHLRIRADDFERNLLEIPHAGWSAGLDAMAGQRSRWDDWGGDAFGFQHASTTRRWSFLLGLRGPGWRGPVLVRRTAPVRPVRIRRRGLECRSIFGISTRRRLELARWETLSAPSSPARHRPNSSPSRYGIVTLEYRYQVLFFLFLQARGTAAWLDRPRREAGGVVGDRTEPLHAATAALTSGLFWNLSVEISWSHNFGVLRDHAGTPRKGGNALFLSLTKLFATRR